VLDHHSEEIIKLSFSATKDDIWENWLNESAFERSITGAETGIFTWWNSIGEPDEEGKRHQGKQDGEYVEQDVKRGGKPVWLGITQYPDQVFHPGKDKI